MIIPLLLPNSSLSKAVAIEIAESSYLPIFDIQGNITKLINYWGSVKQKYDYTSFGEKLNEENLETAKSMTFQNSFRDDIIILRSHHMKSIGINDWVT